jgi:hypothetical protein
MNLDNYFTWSERVNQVGWKAAQRFGVLYTLIKRRSALSIRNGVLTYKKLTRPMIDYAYPIWRSAARSQVRKLQVLQSKCFALRITNLGTLVTGKFTRICVFHSSPTTSEHWLRVSTQIYLMRGTPKFGNLEGTCADQGLTEETHE